MVPERQVVLGPVEVAKIAEGQVRIRAIALANEQPAGDCPRHAAVPIREGVEIRQTRKCICREHRGRHFVATVAKVFGQNSEDHLGTDHLADAGGDDEAGSLLFSLRPRR